VISIAVPTYKERANIAALVERVEDARSKCLDEIELIIVDDDSPDGTAEEVRRLQSGRPWLKLVLRKYERDLSTAVIAGWRVAEGDVLGCMDADLQHPPEVLPRLVQRMRASGADIVLGSRHVKGGGVSDWSLYRRFISWTATLMATFILPGTLGKVRDPMSGFFLIKRSVIEHAVLRPVGYKILLEVLARGDYETINEVPYIFEERAQGGSKISSKTVFYYLAHLLTISLETREAVRIFKYALVGLAGGLVNFLSTVFVFERALRWPLEPAAAAGVGVAMIHNFLWNEYGTFAETRKAQPGAANALQRFLIFVMLSGTGVLLNLGVLAILVQGLGLPHTPSLLAAIAVAGSYNFFVNSNLTWRAWWNRHVLSRTVVPAKASAELPAAGRFDALRRVACNLCGSSRGNVLYAGDPERQPGVTPATFCCTSEQHGDFTNIVQCADCGLLFENPREEESAIEQLYEAVEDPTYLREQEARVLTFSRLLDRLADYAAPNGRLLDVGCYTGVFLDVAGRRGWHTCGVEPSAWAAGKAAGKGHTVVNAPLRQSAFPAGSFDAVTIWDVIEHLHDPLGQLRSARELLKPGGVLGLSTMNADALFAKVTGRHWPWYMRMHLYYFSAGTISRMFEEAGFEVLRIERHKRVSSMRYLMEKAGALVPGVGILLRWIGKPFGRIYLTIDLGDIMNVFARRRER